MCGIIGMVKTQPVVMDLYDGLITLQHRGQDAAGIITYDGKFHLKKGMGLARDVFHVGSIIRLKGNVGLGHVRYITAGISCQEESQPFFTDSPFGIGLVHNGNLTNYDELKEMIQKTTMRYLNTSSDSELILTVLANELYSHRKMALKPKEIFDSIQNVFKKVKGSYACIAYIAGHGMVAFRDPYGIRPLTMGKRTVGLGDEYIFASEDVATHSLEFTKIKDLKNGEIVYIDKNYKVHNILTSKEEHKPCIFEYVYLARPDSMLDDVSVNKARTRMGDYLAKNILKKDWKIDVVIPVPDSARTAALEIAYKLKIPYREGIIKNRYIGRTFIMPGQSMRKKSIRLKLNTIELEIKGKNVLLVEDSIVRGNTSKKIIQLVKNAGAKKIYFASAAPPLRNACVYGIDMPTKAEFIATNLTEDEICKAIDADGLIYQDLEDLKLACQPGAKKNMSFCTACFDGHYPTKEVTPKLLADIEIKRLKSIEDSQLQDPLESQLTLI